MLVNMFFGKVEKQIIIVDNPCILIIEDGYIYASEPTHKLDYVTVSIGEDDYRIKVNKGYTSKIKINK